MGVLAIDFGGTRIRAGWFAGDDLVLLNRTETLTLADQPQSDVLVRLIDTARAVIPMGTRVQAIGVAAPGPLDAATGIIHHARTLPGWYDVPLAQIIQREFGAPVYVQNDANLAALAEFHHGAAKGADPLIYLTISTGIGGGAILGGRIFTGWRGLAIEPGHLRFPLPDGRIMRLEELASGTALGMLARERIASVSSDELPSVLRDKSRIDGRAVGDAARAGDALARAVVDEAGRWLGFGLVSILHLFNPQAVILGGSVSSLGDLMLEPARAVIREHILAPGFYGDKLISITRLGDDVCLVGAAFHARNHMMGTPHINR